MSHFHADDEQCPRGIDAGAYVLQALDADERRAYAEHVAGCAHCGPEVAALRRVVDTLPLAAPQVAPPAALKSRIMSVVTAESELLLAAGPAADRLPAAGRTPRRRWLPSAFALRPALAGALACALLAVGVVGGLVAQGGDPSTQFQPGWAEGPAEARLALTGDKASLELTGMPSPPKGQVYQVWFDRGDGQPRPTATLFNVRPGGRAKIAIAESVKGVDRILVTAEPSGGSLAPSGAPVITASPA